MAELITTAADAVAEATAILAAAEIASPRRVALRLWRELDHAPGIDPVTNRDAAVTGPAYREAATRLAAGEPMQYVTGRAGFRRLELAVDRRALIPRPETEGLVDAALARVRHGTAVDIGTGSGAIALSLALEGEFDEVIGTDVSTEALALARHNGARCDLAVTWSEGDMLAPLADRQVDLIVSNPPYLTAEEYRTLDRSVRDHEPALALPSGADGLDATRALLFRGIASVVSGGWIALEIDCRRGHESAAIAAAAGWGSITVQDDLFGRARYLLARRENER